MSRPSRIRAIHRDRVAAYVESAPGSIGAAPLAQAAVCRVATDGLAANDGSTWALATTLLSALGNANCDEIWVKAGVYKPVVPANAAAVTVPERAASFAINRPLKLYGGFAGTETALNGRVLSSFNKTVLSGDIDDNDSNKIDGITPDAGDIAGSNSYHVVVIGGLTGDGNCQYTDSNTVLDGLTITGGYANGAASGNPPHNWGGGLYCNGRGTGKASGPLLTHMAFIGNRAGDSGVAGYGGALYNDARFAGTSSPWLINVTFSGNAAAGTAIVNNASTASSVARPKLLNVTLYHLDDSTTVMENWGAESDQGTNKGVSFPVVYLSIVWGKIKNTEFPAGTGTYTGRATFLYSIVKNSGCPAGCDPSVGNFLLSSNLSGDPLLSAATDHGGGTWTMLPGAGSPALDSPETSCGHYSSGLGDMVTTAQRCLSRPQGTG